MSVLTESLRFPLCDTSNYSTVFEGIADQVIASSPIACELPLPMPPDNNLINLASLDVEYTPMGMGTPVQLYMVPSEADCAADSYWVENDIIYLCPETCAVIQGDLEAEIDMEYLCLQPG